MNNPEQTHCETSAELADMWSLDHKVWTAYTENLKITFGGRGSGKSHNLTNHLKWCAGIDPTDKKENV